jgi:hypothetical protein
VSILQTQQNNDFVQSCPLDTASYHQIFIEKGLTLSPNSDTIRPYQKKKGVPTMKVYFVFYDPRHNDTIVFVDRYAARQFEKTSGLEMKIIIE